MFSLDVVSVRTRRNNEPTFVRLLGEMQCARSVLGIIQYFAECLTVRVFLYPQVNEMNKLDCSKEENYLIKMINIAIETKQKLESRTDVRFNTCQLTIKFKILLAE